MKRSLVFYTILLLCILTLVSFSKAQADPIFPLTRLPFCGDQDGSENPQIFNCDSFSVNPNVQAYRVNFTDQSAEIKFDFVFREAGYNNELGLFKVDDETFSVDGLLPGDNEYLSAVYKRMKIIFPSGADAYTPDITMSFEDGDILAFFIIQNNTLDQWKVSNPNNDYNLLPLAFFSIDSLNPDGIDHFVGYQNTTDNLTQFGFEDLTDGGDLDFDDVVYNMSFLGQPVTNAPTYTTSYYVENRDRQGIYNLGCEQGIKDRDLAGAQDSIVVLDFYGPRQRVVNRVTEYGLSLLHWAFVPMSEVADYAEQFALGYYICTGADYDSHLRLVIGTNNSTSTSVNYEAGRAFGKMVNEVAQWVIDNRLSRQVDIAGGNDMEMGYNTPAATKAWVDGYASISTRYLYNFGDSGGCPQYNSTSNPGGCNNNWTQDDIWYISWKVPPAWPLPEIYNTVKSQARQWQQLSLYSFFKPNYPRMTIAGSMTQYQSCQQYSCVGTDNKPETGWTQLLDELIADSRTSQNLRWSTDIYHWVLKTK
jgi:hypothetical protein